MVVFGFRLFPEPKAETRLRSSTAPGLVPARLEISTEHDTSVEDPTSGSQVKFRSISAPVSISSFFTLFYGHLFYSLSRIQRTKI